MTASLAELHRRMAEAQRRRSASLLIAGVAGVALTAGLPWQRRRSEAGEAWTELTVALPWSWPLIAVASVAVVLVVTGVAVRIGALLSGAVGVAIAAAAAHAVHTTTSRGWRYPFEMGAGAWTGFVAGVLLVSGAIAIWRHTPGPGQATGPRFERRRPTLTDDVRELRRAAVRVEREAATTAPEGTPPPSAPPE